MGPLMFLKGFSPLSTLSRVFYLNYKNKMIFIIGFEPISQLQRRSVVLSQLDEMNMVDREGLEPSVCYNAV